jgi:predicted dehydrogenase
MSAKLRWGILSTASIGLRKVIPGMQRSRLCSIDAIASRSLAKAQSAASKLGIPKAYGSYEELLTDSEIDAIYNPLPNQIHVPWTIKAAEAGKHVLCEKPIAMTAEEARTLLEVRSRTGVKIGEAFMNRTHVQWQRVGELLAEGRIGSLRAVAGFFSYHNTDPANIRNQVECGGGALLDIGCYCVHVARHAFGRAPARVVGLVDRDPAMHIDRLTSALMDFGDGHCIFTCSTQMVPYQRVQFLGTRGRIEVEIPFNAPQGSTTRLLIDDGSDVTGRGIVTEVVPACDQYAEQGDAFARAVLENGEVPVPLEDAIENMTVIDAVFRSAKTERWERPDSRCVGFE